MIKTNSYCVNYAKIFGPLSAIYIDMLSSINKEDIVLSRGDISDMTGIDDITQLKVEDSLNKLGIIRIKNFKGDTNKNHYYFDPGRLEYLKDNINITALNDLCAPSSPKKNEKQKKGSKKETMLRQLKNCIINIDDAVLQQYYCDWIDSVIERGGFLTTQSVKLNIESLNNFTTDQGTAIEVLKIAIINGWRDLHWAIEKVKPKTNKNGNNFTSYSDIKGTKTSLMEEAF